MLETNSDPRHDRGAPADDAPLHRLLSALPGPAYRFMVRLRRPGRGWVRVPLAVLLILGGLLGFLPILGLWMLPLGLLLLAEDIPALRKPTMRALGAVHSWWDRWQARRGKA